MIGKHSISPAERFVQAIAIGYDVLLPGIYINYKLPAGESYESLEEWVVNNHQTNSSTRLESHFVNALLGGNRYESRAVYPAIKYGDAMPRTREALSDKAAELIQLNPVLQRFVPEELSVRQLYNLVWGVACKFTPDDLEACLTDVAEYLDGDVELLADAKERDDKKRVLLRQIEAISGVKPEWLPSENTSRKILESFERNEEKMRTGFEFKLSASMAGWCR